MKHFRLLGLLGLFTLFSIYACDWSSALTLEEWLDIINPPEPVEQDTCIPTLYTEPAFVTGVVYIDEIITTDVVMFAGSYTDTIHAGEDMADKLKNLLYLYDPAYTYQVWVSDTDWRKVCFIARGTNDHTHYNGKVRLRFNDMFSSRGFISARQAFIFNGALSYDEYNTAIDSFPSYDYINWIGTDWDSTEYDHSARKAAKCKIGRYYANFRFNAAPLAPDIPILYDSIGWEVVLH